jgi:hypothetical protein
MALAKSTKPRRLITRLQTSVLSYLILNSGLPDPSQVPLSAQLAAANCAKGEADMKT